MNRNIIFLGGIGKTNAFGGELSKNKFLLNFLVSHNYSVKLVNSHNARKCPFKLLKLFIYLFFLKRADLVISTSFGNISWLIKLLYYLNPQRKVYYWCIGGTFHTRVVNGEFNIKYISYIKEIYVEAHLMKRTLSLCGLTNVINSSPKIEHGVLRLIPFEILPRTADSAESNITPYSPANL